MRPCSTVKEPNSAETQNRRVQSNVEGMETYQVNCASGECLRDTATYARPAAEVSGGAD
jgi:hypothetical protein